MTFGERLRTARKRAKLSQTKLAELVGLKQSQITMLETGQRSSTTAVAEIAAATGCDALWLATGKGEPGWTPGGWRELADTYRAATPEERQIMLNVALAAVGKSPSEPEPAKKADNGKSKTNKKS